MLRDAVEWNFIHGLQFKQHTPEDADFIRMMYTIRLRKVGELASFPRGRMSGD